MELELCLVKKQYVTKIVLTTAGLHLRRGEHLLPPPCCAFSSDPSPVKYCRSHCSNPGQSSKEISLHCKKNPSHFFPYTLCICHNLVDSDFESYSLGHWYRTCSPIKRQGPQAIFLGELAGTQALEQREQRRPSPTRHQEKENSDHSKTQALALQCHE